MLVINARLNEEIVIQLPDGETITLQALGIKGSKVRLGFEGPKRIPIHRKEIYDAIHDLGGEG